MRRLFGFHASFALGRLILFCEDPVKRFCQCNKSLVRGASQPFGIVEPMEHRANDVQSLQQGGHRFSLVNSRLLLV